MKTTDKYYWLGYGFYLIEITFLVFVLNLSIFSYVFITILTLLISFCWFKGFSQIHSKEKLKGGLKQNENKIK